MQEIKFDSRFPYLPSPTLNQWWRSRYSSVNHSSHLTFLIFCGAETVREPCFNIARLSHEICAEGMGEDGFVVSRKLYSRDGKDAMGILFMSD